MEEILKEGLVLAKVVIEALIFVIALICVISFDNCCISFLIARFNNGANGFAVIYNVLIGLVIIWAEF